MIITLTITFLFVLYSDLSFV